MKPHELTDGHNQFRAWMRRMGFNTQREAATFLGVHYTYVCQIYGGTRTPGLDTAFAIEDKTGIPARAWRRQSVGLHNVAEASNQRGRKANPSNVYNA